MIEPASIGSSVDSRTQVLVEEKSRRKSGSLFKWLAMLLLLGMLVLLPISFLELPLNLSVVELWSLLLLPVIWIYLLAKGRTIHLPYLLIMWLILLASLLSIFMTPKPVDSLVVLLKDFYIFVWFIMIVSFLAAANERFLRLFLLVWMGVAVAHSLLLILQFLSPGFFEAMRSQLGSFGALDLYRPSGFYENANSAAFYALLSFVPLFLLRLSRRLTALLAAFLFLGILATGSLGAMAALIFGALVAILALSVQKGNLLIGLRYLVLMALVGLVVVVSFSFALAARPDFMDRLEYTFFGRARGSAEGRFDLWKQGIEVLSSHSLVLGIGPDAFTEFNDRGTYLHNDFLAFFVERGLIGAIGLASLGLFALWKSFRLLRITKGSGEFFVPTLFIFPAAIMAIMLYSQTHQIFHDRSVWLVIAMLEVLLIKFTMAQERPIRSFANWRHLDSETDSSVQNEAAGYAD